MPYRKSSIRHPLKRVRSIIGLDQRTVALRAACSTVTIKRIEQGTLALSRPLADKLEAALGVSAAYLSEIETGKKEGSLSVIKKIAEALGVKIDDLI
jgi:transcriptional regulator with XRE-family HTH domain